MGANDPIDVQVANMRKWAQESVMPQLKELQAKLAPSVEQMDAIGLELAELHVQYADVRVMAQEAQARLDDINVTKIPPLKEQMTVLEAQAELDAVDINTVTGKPFTVAQCAARAKIALNGNADYQNLAARQRELEREAASHKAILSSFDSALSEYRNRNRALVARLNNLTARMG